jgi:hypothetical protein
MPKQKITIHLDSEIAEKLRLQSIKKYGNSRSMSHLIEDLATGAAETKQPETCSMLGHRTEFSLAAEATFKEVVEEITAQLKEIKVMRTWEQKKGKPDKYPILGPEWFFALKEACELEINKQADLVNVCWSCSGLNGPLPKYETAGKNFELRAMLDNTYR